MLMTAVVLLPACLYLLKFGEEARETTTAAAAKTRGDGAFANWLVDVGARVEISSMYVEMYVCTNNMEHRHPLCRTERTEIGRSSSLLQAFTSVYRLE